MICCANCEISWSAGNGFLGTSGMKGIGLSSRVETAAADAFVFPDVFGVVSLEQSLARMTYAKLIAVVLCMPELYGLSTHVGNYFITSSTRPVFFLVASQVWNSCRYTIFSGLAA